MGWDITKKKERKKWLKERKKLAEKLSDMPLKPGKQPVWDPGWKEPLGWEPTGYTPGPSAADIAKWNRLGTRLARKDAQRAATPPAESWLDAPAYVPQEGQPGQYGRWTASGNWPWYAPQAQVADQPHLAIINRLLPYMGGEDVTTMARQLYTAGGGAGGPFKGYLDVPTGPTPAMAGGVGAAIPGTYGATLGSIGGILGKIPDPVARDWAASVFDVYKDMTKGTGIRGREEEAVFKTQLDELFANVPETAQPYAAAMQRVVAPTVRRPGREWYEMPAERRTAPTNWSVMGFTRNPAWM